MENVEAAAGKETFEEFCLRMGKVEKSEELVVGPRHAGSTRAIFDFEGEHCFLESFNCFSPSAAERARLPPAYFAVRAAYHPPSHQWVLARLFYTKKRVKALAKHYGARGFDEDPYPRESGVWFYLYFVEFEDLMRIVWDLSTGRFKELWGAEAKEYESCIGYLEEAK